MTAAPRHERLRCCCNMLAGRRGHGCMVARTEATGLCWIQPWFLLAFNDHLQSVSTGQVRAAAGPSRRQAQTRPKALADLQQNELGGLVREAQAKGTVTEGTGTLGYKMPDERGRAQVCKGQGRPMDGGGVKDEVKAVELKVLRFTQRMVENVGASLPPQRVSRAACRLFSAAAQGCSVLLAGSASALAAPFGHVQVVADAQLRLRWRRHAGRPQNVRLLLNGHPAASGGQTDGGLALRHRATIRTGRAPAPTRPSTPNVRMSAPPWQSVAHPPHTPLPSSPASLCPASAPRGELGTVGRQVAVAAAVGRAPARVLPPAVRHLFQGQPKHLQVAAAGDCSGRGRRDGPEVRVVRGRWPCFL